MPSHFLPIDVLLCRSVTINRMISDRGNLVLVAYLDLSRLQYVRWRSTQRLKSGSLLAISRDRFTGQALFATVHDRDSEKISRDGLFTLKIEKGIIFIFIDISNCPRFHVILGISCYFLYLDLHIFDSLF